MVKSIVENGNLPKWATVILLCILSFLLVTFISDLRAQDEAAAKEIASCKTKTDIIDKELTLLKQGVQYDVKALTEKICDLSAAQDKVASKVDDNTHKIDRMSYLLERFAEKEGIR